jgi:uncharacterized membrane protein (UPF0136 family)
MVVGSVAGLIAYYEIGWFVASLVGAAVSGIVFGIATWIAPDNFEFSLLAESRDSESDQLVTRGAAS